MSNSGATIGDGIAQMNANLAQSPPAVLTAIGASQASGTPIPVGVNVVRCLGATSAAGIVLPEQTAFVGAGGTSIWILPQETKGVTIYPSSGQGIKATATNGALVVASGKPAQFIAVGTGLGGSAAYRWQVQKGG